LRALGKRLDSQLIGNAFLAIDPFGVTVTPVDGRVPGTSTVYDSTALADIAKLMETSPATDLLADESAGCHERAMSLVSRAMAERNCPSAFVVVYEGLLIITCDGQEGSASIVYTEETAAPAAADALTRETPSLPLSL
jgi:hypothetical protein